MSTERIVLSPKDTFCKNAKAASLHCDMMAMPAFQNAAATALLTYQFKLGANAPDVLALSMSKLRGAQEFLRELMNLGIPDDKTPTDTGDAGTLEAPEKTLDRPYAPPKR